MSDTAVKHRLGDIVFLVRENGVIARSVVNSVGLENSFSILEHSYRKEHPSFAAARQAAIDLLKKKEVEVSDVLSSVRAQIKLISSSKYKETVMKEPFVKSSTGFIGDQKIDAAFSAPAAYLEPGTRVYAVITPKTHNMMQPHYRPHPYFVLESMVISANLASNGKVQYRVDSYWPGDIYPDIEQAKKKLLEAFSIETGGTLREEDVKLVTADEEKNAEAESTRKISEQLKPTKRFDRLSAGD